MKPATRSIKAPAIETATAKARAIEAARRDLIAKQIKADASIATRGRIIAAALIFSAACWGAAIALVLA